jgi:hypothetical protein
MVVEITRRQEELMERAVSALERMAEDPVIEMETAPPVCPHCEKFNPDVRIHEAEASGPMSEFVIQAQCLTCIKVFYALPFQWAAVRTVEEVKNLLEEKLTEGGYNQGNNSGT